MNEDKAILALADGTIFEGRSIGAKGEVNGEIVFNTSMSGYQEILTDPSYAKQIVTLTYPHIGNTGTNSEDEESNDIWCSGLVVRSVSQIESNWRTEETLSEYLIRNNIQGISDIDTRKLTRIIRNKGAQSASISAGENISYEAAIDLAKQFDGLAGMDLAKEVTVSSSYQWTEGTWRGEKQKSKLRVAVLDFGIKKNILRILADKGYKITVFPAKTSYEEIMNINPDGVFLSNGPGDPEPCSYAIETITSLAEINIPLFGICLGHQLLALSLGGKTTKMNIIGRIMAGLTGAEVRRRATPGGNRRRPKKKESQRKRIPGTGRTSQCQWMTEKKKTKKKKSLVAWYEITTLTLSHHRKRLQ